MEVARSQKLVDAAVRLPLGSVAPRWKCALAYLFGKRVEGRDGSHYCIGYYWRGALYLTESSAGEDLRQRNALKRGEK